jgi:ADP-ribose pyrophosphatase YjhB (NUDIX family)
MTASRVAVGTGAVAIRDDRKVLLVMDRAAKAGGRAGRWGIIGGMLEGDLTFEDNVIKETLEETGYEVAVTGLVGVYQHVSEGMNRISVIYLVQPKERVADPQPDEIEAVRWFSVDDIPFDDLRFPHNAEMIRDALRLSSDAAAERLATIKTCYLGQQHQP